MKNKVILITQARISSSRLPAKVLKKIKNKTLLEIHLERILKSKLIDKVIVATTQESESEKIIEIANKKGVGSYRGSTEDVLDRYFQASTLYGTPEYVIRVTSDCPLISPDLIDQVVSALIKNPHLDYVSNNLKKSFPHGLDVEGFKWMALRNAWQNAKSQQEREHVTPYIRNNSSYLNGNIFQSYNIENKEDLYHFRITVDYLEDFELISRLVTEMGYDKKWEEYIQYLMEHPDVRLINEMKESK